ncbi:hypothetical protein AX16_004007 [Volvariella volvacea WC 439]|nr:hypothetical protein AX16_004007 [Volvariella volvacea WC 439]
MQSKAIVAILFACMTAFVSAAPTPAPINPPLDVEARAIPEGIEAREPVPEANPEPICRYYCV